MTREDAREALWSNGHGDSNWIIAKIYNDHEAQLKAKDEEIEKYKSLHNLAKGSLNKASDYTRLLEKQLKAKDEEIERLKELIRRYESDE